MIALFSGEPLRLRVQLSKTGAMRFLSHTEYWRTVTMGARRAGLPLVYTGKFRPRMRISISPPLPVGVESRCEFADFCLSKYVSPAEAQSTLSASLPDGIDVLRAKIMSPGSTPVGKLIDTASYSAVIEDAGGLYQKVEAAVREFLGAESVVIVRVQPRSVREIDIRKGVHELYVERGRDFGKVKLGMIVDDGVRGTVKPKEVLACVLEKADAGSGILGAAHVTREALFQKRGRKFISPMEVRAKASRRMQFGVKG